MEIAHTELDLLERRAVGEVLKTKVPITKIAAEIGRYRTTVYREIKRNSFTDEELPYLNSYYGLNAQKSAADRRVRRRKPIRLNWLREAIIDRLKDGWSPKQNAGRLGLEGRAIRGRHETIYAHVYTREGQSEALARYLP